MKKLILLFITATLFMACDENENLKFDSKNGQTLNYFAKNNANLQIPIGDGNMTTMDIVFGITTVSNEDRTIVFSVDTDNTDAPDAMYSFNSMTATVPAGEHEGIVQITGNYDVMLDAGDKKVTLKIDNVSSGYYDTDSSMEIKVSMYCPIPDDYFVGMYMLEQTSSFVDGPTLNDGTVVEVTSDGDGGVKRTFSTQNYPNYCSAYMDFTVDLVCNEIIVGGLDSVCSCGDGASWFTAAEIPAAYDLASDAVMYITFTDDAQNNCGTPAQTTYKLTKQ